MTNNKNDDTIASKNSGLSSENNLKHNARHVGRIDVNDEEAYNNLVKRFEDKYAENTREHCLVITPEGEVYIARGDAYSVNTDLLGDKMLGSFTTHNHPETTPQ